jgi:hypothetical protein
VSPDFRKVALIAATLGLLVSIFVALRADDEEGSTPGGLTGPAATAAETVPPETVPPETGAAPTTPAEPQGPETFRIEVASDEPPTPRTFTVRQGREVELLVESELADLVHLHGYDLMADVGPGRVGRITFTADAPGRFEVELEERHLPIATLEVRP